MRYQTVSLPKTTSFTRTKEEEIVEDKTYEEVTKNTNIEIKS